MNTLVTLNIGLNNNPFTAEQIKAMLFNRYTLRYKQGLGAIIETFVVMSEYQGNPEPTLVAKISNTHNMFSHWKSELQSLSTRLEQDSIAFRIESTDDNGFKTTKQALAFSPEYAGKHYEFDEQYFITEPTKK